MSCERFTRAITDHACGADLDGRTAAHLGACESCRRRLEQTRQKLDAAEAGLRRALALTASPEFAARVSARVRQEEPAISTWPARNWLGLAAGAALIVGGLVTWPREGFFSGPREHAQQAAPARAHATPGEPPDGRTGPSVQPPTVEQQARSSPRRRYENAQRTPRRQAAVATQTAEPEVIVPRDQQRAIARLRELLQSGALDQDDVPIVPAESSALAALVVQPLAVPDIIIPDVNRRSGTPPPAEAVRDRP